VDLIHAVVIGIVQGLTEYLPVSSTAHIRVIPALLGWPDPGAAYTAVVQVGTLVAVLLYFAKDIGRAISAWAKGFGDPEAAKTPEAKLGWAVFIGTIPIIVVGVLFHSQIEQTLRSLYIVAASLIAMGLVLLASERIGAKGRNMSLVRPLDGLWVGFWQCVALIPGASRSGCTISGALLLGFDKATAARFSFLLSVPSVLAAAIYELVKQRHDLLGAGLPAVIVGNVFSFIVGYWSIAFLMRFLQTRGVLPFVLYRVALGLALFGLLAAGVVHPDEGLEGHATKTAPEASTTHVPS
jgi:undecaprenyl-diphosphatase